MGLTPSKGLGSVVFSSPAGQGAARPQTVSGVFEIRIAPLQAFLAVALNSFRNRQRYDTAK